MIEVALAKKYATALLNTTPIPERVHVLESTLSVIDLLQTETTVFQTLTSPRVPRLEKEALISSLLKTASVSLSVVTFFKLLHRKNRLEILFALKPVVKDLLNDCSRTVPVTIEVATDITVTTQQKIESLIAQHTDKTIVTEYKVNTDLMGGFKATLAGTVIDASLQNTLENLKEAIQSV